MCYILIKKKQIFFSFDVTPIQLLRSFVFSLQWTCLEGKVC